MILTNIIFAEMSKYEQQKFETIRAVAGNHVCETDSTIIEITESATETVNFALKVGKSCVIQHFARTENEQASLKGENVNVKFKDNDGSFRLADGSPNDALLMPHGNTSILNNRGSEKLAKNLGLPTEIRRIQRSQ